MGKYEGEIIGGEGVLCPKPMMTEITALMKTIKNAKVPGEDTILIQLIRNGWEARIKYVHKY